MKAYQCMNIHETSPPSSARVLSRNAVATAAGLGKTNHITAQNGIHHAGLSQNVGISRQWMANKDHYILITVHIMVMVIFSTKIMRIRGVQF